MKLLRVGPAGQEKPAILDSNGVIRDLSSVVSDINGAALSATSLEKLAKLDTASLPEISSDERIGSCVAEIGKYVCIGLNYAEHVREAGAEMPSEPVVFNKWISAVCGPNDDIIKPRNSIKMDWEVELGIVIGEECRYVSEADAEKYIAGYCVINDVSERHFQLERNGQWDKGKGCDTFGPTGPWLVTKDEAGDVNKLGLWLEVNGKRFQDSTTSEMIFNPVNLVSYLSQFMSLQAGDVIATGTPSGVGLGQTPQVFLNVGDTMRVGIDGLGEQNQTVVACPE